MKTKFAVGVVLGLMGASFAAPASATSIVFTDFSNLSGLQLNGSTRSIHNPNCTANGGNGSFCSTVTDFSGNKVLCLTNDLSQGGSAFSTSAISLAADASFSTSFRFRFTDQQNSGADGIVFAVQTVSNTSGGIGGGIGYANLLNSVGIEFDNWNNGSGDGHSANHVGININGNVNSVVLNDITDEGFILDSGTTFTAWVDYNGVTDLLEVRLAASSIRPLAAILSHTVNLVTVLGTTNAFVGFTSGTGAAGADHDILAWQFNDDFEPINEIGVPAPGALALIGLGLFGIGLIRRRR